MKFKVTDISFDLTENFNDRDQLFGEYIDTEMLASQLQRAYTKTSWEADNLNDLLEQISDASGWCINSIQYEEISLNCSTDSLVPVVALAHNTSKGTLDVL